MNCSCRLLYAEACGFDDAAVTCSGPVNPAASAYNNLQEQFIGDYTDLVAGPRSSYLVWTDASDAALCSAVGAYQAQVYAGSKTAVAPNPDFVCPTAFGNTDDVVAVINN